MPHFDDYDTLTALLGDDEVLVRDKHDTSNTGTGASASAKTKRMSGTNLATSMAGLSGSVMTIPLSGDTTGADDLAAINAVISAGGSALLAKGIYYVNGPLTPATGASLSGAQPWSASPYDAYGAGTGQVGGSVIQGVPGFTGTAVINMTNATGTQYYGVSLANFVVDASQISSSTPEGMHVEGAWGACFMDGVMLFNSGGHCLHFATNGTSNFNPDDWLVSRCKFSASYEGCGVYADNLPDSWFTDCESSENQLDNWQLAYSLNTTLTRCKGENSAAGAGFRLGGQGGLGRALNLTACTTHLNYEDGFLFDNSAAGSGGIYQLANCTSINDNQAAGTTYSGFRSAGCPNVIQAVGCSAYGAYYGASQTGTTGGMLFTASSLAGSNAATHDDGTGTGRLVYNGSDTSGTATASTPTFTSGTAKQLSVTQDVMFYIAVKTAISVTLAIGSTSSAATSIIPATTLPVGSFVAVRIPRNFYVKLTCATMGDLQLSQVTC